MKVVYPKNIQKGMLAGMTFQIGPINLSIIQLVVVAIGVSAGLGLFNALSKSGGKALGIFAAIIVIIITIIIAFFKVSELALIPYVAKMIRNNFLDTKKKFQINYERFDPIKIVIKKNKDKEQKQSIEQKDSKIDKSVLENINKEGLL